MSSDRPWLDSLRDSSAALQGVLGALLEAERQFAPPASPLERLRQITTSPEWAWLQPLYRLIADVDHALAYADDLPASESAAIGAHARELLTGGSAAAEQPFLEHYRALPQTDPAVAMAHVAEGDAHAVNREVTEVDIGCGDVVAALHVEGHPDDVLVRHVARRMSHQGIAQHEVADRPLGTGVDDRLGAHTSHAHVGDQQP